MSFVIVERLRHVLVDFQGGNLGSVQSSVVEILFSYIFVFALLVLVECVYLFRFCFFHLTSD